MLPTALAACSDNSTTGPRPGSGNALTIDFANGDFAVLQFAYALEQLEADFYTRVVAAFNGSNLSSDEQAVLADIKNHEVIHREFLKAALGSTYGFTITATYPNVSFNSRTSVLATAAAFEDLGVAAYNGAAQYISSTDYLTLAGKIVSVEARHASAIHDLIAPKTDAFAPQATDRASTPTKAAGGAPGCYCAHHPFPSDPRTIATRAHPVPGSSESASWNCSTMPRRSRPSLAASSPMMEGNSHGRNNPRLMRYAPAYVPPYSNALPLFGLNFGLERMIARCSSRNARGRSGTRDGTAMPRTNRGIFWNVV